MILRDYSCMAHGHFESTKAECPHGCKGGMVSIVHTKAPGTVSARTRGIDKTTRNLASQFGLTDMDNRGGQPVKRPDPMAAKRAEEYQKFIQEKFGSPWQSVANGNPIQHIEGIGAQGGSAVIRDEIGGVSVPFNGGEYSVPLSKQIKPDAIAGEHKADV